MASGGNGGNGRDGGGFQICAPWWLGGGCINIGVDPTNGGGGGGGGSPSRTSIGSGHGSISTTANNAPGIKVGSRGGNGGKGGNGYVGTSGADGGAGGNGGNLSITNYTTVNTGGCLSTSLRIPAESTSRGKGRTTSSTATCGTESGSTWRLATPRGPRARPSF